MIRLSSIVMAPDVAAHESAVAFSVCVAVCGRLCNVHTSKAKQAPSKNMHPRLNVMGRLNQDDVVSFQAGIKHLKSSQLLSFSRHGSHVHAHESCSYKPFPNAQHWESNIPCFLSSGVSRLELHCWTSPAVKCGHSCPNALTPLSPHQQTLQTPANRKLGSLQCMPPHRCSCKRTSPAHTIHLQSKEALASAPVSLQAWFCSLLQRGQI